MQSHVMKHKSMQQQTQHAYQPELRRMAVSTLRWYLLLAIYSYRRVNDTHMLITIHTAASVPSW